MIYAIKFLYSWLLPPAIFVLLLLYLAWRCRKRMRRMTVLLVLTALLLYLCALSPVAELLLHRLEYQYAPADYTKADVIVVLGGGTVANVPAVPGWSGQLHDVAAQRILAAYVLHRKTGLPVLASGGEVYAGEGRESVYMRDILVSMGMDGMKALIEDRSLNTTENAQFTAQVLKERGFSRPLLVTSAFHMPRSVKNFSQFDVAALPYPVGYYTSRTGGPTHFLSWVPSYSAMRGTGLALKEYMGLIALKVKG